MYPNTVRTAGERGDEAMGRPPCYPTHNWGNIYYVYLMATRLFENESLEEQLIAEAEWFTWHAPFDVDAGGPDRNVELHYTTAILNIAFELTGDLSYAAYADHLLNNKFLDIVEQYRSGEMMGFQDLSLNFTIPHLENVVAKAMDQDPERFEEVKQEWQETRPGPSEEYEEWSRPDQASERSIGQLSTNPP